jgi:catechol 2,3-dioxygenase-like lactoylglutathione lyase family enzyme
MAILGLDHVQVAAPAGCEDEARRFYGELLGLKEIPKPDALAGRGGVWFRVGAQELHVGVEEGFRPSRKAHPALAVDHLATLRERLRSAGVETRDDVALPGVVDRLHVRDPWGNRLELLVRR